MVQYSTFNRKALRHLEQPKKLEDGESDDKEDKGMQPSIDEDEDP